MCNTASVYGPGKVLHIELLVSALILKVKLFVAGTCELLMSGMNLYDLVYLGDRMALL